MTISPVSPIHASHGTTAPIELPAKSSGPSQPPADSVHLSAAAKAHLAGADADGDGDGK